MSENDFYLRDEEAHSNFDLHHILEIVQLNWYWFLLSVLVCVSAAQFYIWKTAAVYTRSASVLINEDKKSGLDISQFMDVNMVSTPRNVDNEVLVFKSKYLMKEVIEALALHIDYTHIRPLRTVDLYKKTPLQLHVLDNADTQSFACVLIPLINKRYRITDIVLPESHPAYNQSIDYEQVFALNDTVTTPIGRLVVAATPHLSQAYIGTQLVVRYRPTMDAALYYLGRVTIAPMSKTTSLIQLSVNDTNIARAEDLLNMLIIKYNKNAIKDKKWTTEQTSNFIDDRLHIISKELGDVDGNIEAYKKNNNLTNIAVETGMVLETGVKYRAEHVHLKNQIQVVRYIQNYLHQSIDDIGFIPENAGLNDGRIEDQITEYNALWLEIDKLSSAVSSHNPTLVEYNRTLVAMRRSITHSIDNLVLSLNMRESSLIAKEREMTDRISLVPTQEKYVMSVERQQKIKEELFLFLLNKREENAISMAIVEGNARVIDAASGSNSPVAPKAAMILLAAALLGVMIPAGILYIINLLNTKVYGRDAVKQATSIPFLGEIPFRKYTKQEIFEGKNVVSEAGRDCISEAFRILRVNLDFMLKNERKKETQVIMLTSAVHGSGKTFASVNLALTLAQSSKRVILVDTDIRKATLTKNWEQNPHGGLTDFLSGRVADIDNLIMQSDLSPNLHVINAGPIASNPVSLLQSSLMEDLTATLRSRYDYIIMDNVPAMVVADAMIVNRLVDLTIYVIREGYFDKRMFPELEQIHKEERFKNMVILLNGTRMHKWKHGYGYGYGYGYGNGYGYGYGDDPAAESKSKSKSK